KVTHGQPSRLLADRINAARSCPATITSARPPEELVTAQRIDAASVRAGGLRRSERAAARPPIWSRFVGEKQLHRRAYYPASLLKFRLGAHRMPARQPNILFIVVDDCGYADLGCTGQTDYRTPSLDRLVPRDPLHARLCQFGALHQHEGRVDDRPLPV